MKKAFMAVMVLCMIAICVPAWSPAAEEKGIDFRNVETMVVLFVTTPEAVRGLVPDPLVPNPWNLMYLVIERLNWDGIDYHHMILGIPVNYQGSMYNFNLYRIVDNETISARNEAVSGWKTPMGRITFERKDGKVRGAVERDGRVLASAEVEGGQPGVPLETPPMVFLREIPYPPQAGVTPEVKQLLWATSEITRVHETFDGRTTLKLDKPLRTPVDIPVLGVFRGVYRKADASLKPGGILYDYMKK